MSSTAASSTSPPANKFAATSVPGAFSALAAIALVVSLAGPTWLALLGNFDVSFPTLRTQTSLGSAPGIQHAYFGWLAWTLTIAVIVLLAGAMLIPIPAVTRVSGIAVIVVALLGAVLTLACVGQLSDEDPSGNFFTHFAWIRVGGYLHVVGWVLAIAAIVLASRGARDRGTE